MEAAQIAALTPPALPAPDLDVVMEAVKNPGTRLQGLKQLCQVLQNYRALECPPAPTCTGFQLVDSPADDDFMRSCGRADILGAVADCFSSPDGAIRRAAVQAVESYVNVKVPWSKMYKSISFHSRLPDVLLNLVSEQGQSASIAGSAARAIAKLAVIEHLGVTFLSAIPGLLRVWKEDRISQESAGPAVWHLLLQDCTKSEMRSLAAGSIVNVGAPTQLVAIMTDDRPISQKTMAAQIVGTLASCADSSHEVLHAAGVMPALAALLHECAERRTKFAPLWALTKLIWSTCFQLTRDFGRHIDIIELFSVLNSKEDPNASDQITQCSLELLLCFLFMVDTKKRIIFFTTENVQHLLSVFKRSTNTEVKRNAACERPHLILH